LGKADKVGNIRHSKRGKHAAGNQERGWEEKDTGRSGGRLRQKEKDSKKKKRPQDGELSKQKIVEQDKKET